MEQSDQGLHGVMSISTLHFTHLGPIILYIQVKFDSYGMVLTSLHSILA